MPRRFRLLGALTLALVLAGPAPACERGESGPEPEKLPLPPEAIEHIRPPPPPPPPPPPRVTAIGPPAVLRSFLTTPAPLRVTMKSLPSKRTVELAPERAGALVSQLLLHDSWVSGSIGCVSDGTEVRIERDDGSPPLDLWTSCGNVVVFTPALGAVDATDHVLGTWSRAMMQWFVDLCAANGLEHQ